VEKRKIDVLYEAPAIELITKNTPTGLSVIGVIAEQNGKRIRIRAHNGVILSCGGFDGNSTFKKNFLMPGLKSESTPLVTGDAIKMTAKVEAQLWHMNSANMAVGHEIPGVPQYSISSLVFTYPKSQISVNRRGKRFVNEGLNSYDMMARCALAYDPRGHEYSNNPFWVVFDEHVRLAGPAGFGTPMGRPTEIYAWSPDNSEEVRKGWILKADSIAELAGKMKVDPRVLEDTVAHYNQGCSTNSDPDFGRTVGLMPIQNGPFYALKSEVCTFSTNGGPRINSKGQVINMHGNVVPGLYAAGAASCYAVAFVYPLSGTDIADALVMGRITGRFVAKAKQA
jgi:succinate dehydrogenase/fumarate reductase flavoprotein subunit